MFTIKEFKKTKYNNYFNYLRLSDKNFHNLFLLTIIGFVIVSFSFFSKMNGLNNLAYGINLNSWFTNRSVLWSDIFLDIIIPLSSSLLICIVFYNDYKNNIYEIFTFYNNSKINVYLLFRYLVYLICIILLSLISILICYSLYIDNLISLFIILFRFIPPIIFLSSLSLYILIIFKSSLISIGLIGIYIFSDIITTGRVFKYFSLYTHSFAINNIYIFIINRCIILFLGIFLCYRSCAKSTTI